MRLTELFILGNRATQLDKLRSDGWQVVTMKAAPVVVAWCEIAGRFHVKAWTFRRDKSDFYYTFKSEGDARKHVQCFVDGIARNFASRIERDATRKEKRATLKASDYFTAGDVLYNSWGYDQTNIDWFQVVEVLPRSIRVRKIKKNFAATGFMCGQSQPRRNNFCGEPFLKTLSPEGRCEYEKWDGKSKYESSYH